MFSKRQHISIGSQLIVVWLIVCFPFFTATAQQKDSLKAATIWAPKNASRLIEHKMDSLERKFFQLGDASAILEANSNTYIRNYGLSNLSTLSIRGSSVAQTNVLWNGVPIQNNMLGLTDLSTLPNFFFDKMAVYPSGFNKKGAVQSMAGRLELDTKNMFSTKPLWQSTVFMGYESFENTSLGTGVNYSNKKWNAKLKYFNRQGKNSYVFDNSYTLQDDTIEHAFAIQEQLLADLAYKPNRNQQLSIHYWQLRNYRQIAPLAFENNNRRSERNKVSRLALNHTFSKNKWLVKSAVGYTRDSFLYEDRHVTLIARAQVENIPFNSTVSYYITEKSDVGLSYNQQLSSYHQSGRSDNLNQFGGQLFYNQRDVWKGISANLFLQKQYASIGRNPCTYGARISKLFFKRHFLFASYNTNYRLPTLNELYYFPGGNVHLLPESAQNLELGYHVNYRTGKFSFDNKLVGYSRWVDDWIIWTGAAIFFPSNIAEVWSRGCENTLTVQFEHKDWRLRNTFLYAYNRSTSEDAYFMNDGSVGKQIPYVPLNSWRNNFYVQYKKLSGQCNLSYTGYRFITRDESEFVDAYALLNCFIAYELYIKRHSLQLQAKLNNVLNEDYESVRGRIMPGRNYAFSLIWNGSY